VAIAAAISPYQSIRDDNRALIGRFVEVYCKCDIETLKERDPKGLYEKALHGELPNFTGVSDPYEAPTDPEVVVDTAAEDEAASLDKILQKLAEMGYVPVADERGYTDEEEETIKERLRELGYI